MRYACPVRREGQSPPLSLPLFLAQGFNPGNRPPGRRALKGRQVIVISNRREKHISIGSAIVQFCAGAHY
jgi:hypothetical protein